MASALTLRKEVRPAAAKWFRHFAPRLVVGGGGVEDGASAPSDRLFHTVAFQSFNIRIASVRNKNRC